VALAAAWALAAAPAPVQTTGAQSPLTFTDAVTRALAHSTEHKRAALAMHQAQLDRQIVSYGNDLTATTAASWSAHRPDGGTSISSSKDQSYGITLSKPLYDFGRQSASEAQADSQVRIQSLTTAQVDDTLYWQVAHSYAEVLGAARAADVAERQVEVAEAKLKEFKRTYGQGLQSKSAVVSAEIDAGRAHIAAQTTADALLQTKLDLALLVEDNTAAAHSLADTMVLPPTGLAAPTPEKARKILEGWTEHLQPTPATQILEEQKAALAYERDAVAAAKRPVISGQLSFTESGAWDDLKPLGIAGLGISWDIPWNGQSNDQYEKIGLKAQDIVLATRADEKTRGVAEAAAKRRLQAAASEYRLDNAQLVLLKRQEKLVLESYRLGNATALEVSTAESDVLSLELDKIRLANSLDTALIDIAQARGNKNITALLP